MPESIVKCKYTNIQSWDDSNDWFELSQDYLNIIKGKSESGKSVFFKPFEEGVFPGMYSYKGRSDLVRRGATMGMAEYILTDETYLAFIFELKDTRFIMREKEGEERVFWQKNMPKEIIYKLGLIIDWENKKILNIYTKSNQYPLVYTSPTWNASLMGPVLEDQKTKDSIEYIKIWQKDLEDTLKSCEMKVKYYRIQDEQYHYSDISELEQVRAMANQCSEIYNRLEKILDLAERLDTSLAKYKESKKEVYNVADIEELKQIYICYRSILNYVEKSKKSMKVMANSPKIDADTSTIDRMKSVYLELSTLLSYCSKMTQSMSSYYKAGQSHSAMQNISGEIDKAKLIYSTMNKIRGIGITEVKAMREYQINSQKIAQLKAQVEEIRKNIKVCPTCGQELKEGLWTTTQ